MGLRRSALIVNPVAGPDLGQDWLPDLSAQLRNRFGQLHVVVTEARADAAVAARQAVEAGCTHIFAGGGDGTLNEVVNGIVGAGRLAAGVVIGVIPLGTGNDFARALGIPPDVKAALAIFDDNREVEVDVCRLNDRYFVNASAGGFIADVSEATSEVLKTVAGKLAYLVGGAQAVLALEPLQATVAFAPGARVLNGPSLPTLRMERELFTFAVSNAPLIGGGRLIAPEARYDDGELDVCLIGTMPTIEFINLLRRVASGEHLEDPRVSYVRTSQLILEAPDGFRVNTDGEVIETTRCEYRVLPSAARFLAGRPQP